MLQARPLHFLALSRKNPTLASIESKHSFLKNLRRLPEVYTYVLHGLIYLHHDLGWVLMKSMQFHEQNLNIVFMLCRNIMIVHNGRVTILSISVGGKGHVKFLPFPSLPRYHARLMFSTLRLAPSYGPWHAFRFIPFLSSKGQCTVWRSWC